MSKIYMIILDGAADRPIESLGNITPLEKANTPGLDYIAKQSKQSMITIINDEICPESDSGAMALLSYDPLLYYPGRGTLEGLGTGFIPNDYSYAAFRVNFASYNKEENILDRRTKRGLTDQELKQLSQSISDNINLKDLYDVEFKLLAFAHHRGILCLYSKTIELSGNVSNTDPGFKKKGYFGYPVNNYNPIPEKCIPLDNTTAAKITAEIINVFQDRANKILQNHEVNKKRIIQGKLPSNFLLIRDGGSTPKKLPQFKNKFNLSLSMYGQLPAEAAIAKLIGGKFNYSKGLDLQIDKNFLENAEKKFINDNADIKFIHLKGPDEPGHDGLPIEKVSAIEIIDKYFISNLINDINDDDIVIVTCDHSTPCELGIHSTDKVPLMIYSNKLGSDNFNKFCEKNANKGSLNIKTAIEIIPFIKNNLL